MEHWTECPPIAMKSIDYDHLDDGEDNPEAVEFRVQLSCVPTEIWIQEFEQAYRQSAFSLKPPLRISQDLLEIVYLPRYVSELPQYFRFLGLMVQKANDETRRTEEIHAAGSRDRHKDDLRNALKRIQLSA